MEAWTPIIIAVVADIPGILAYIGQLRKGKVDAADILVDSATDLIQPLRAEIAELRVEISKIKKINRLLRRWAAELVKQVVALGGTPCPEPEIPNGDDNA